MNDSCRRKVEAYTEYMQDDQLLFPIKRQWVHKQMKWAADMIGLDKRFVSTHVMRKTAAYHFYQKHGTSWKHKNSWGIEAAAKQESILWSAMKK